MKIDLLEIQWLKLVAKLKEKFLFQFLAEKLTFRSPIWFFQTVSTNEHDEHGISPFDGHAYVTTLLMRLVKIFSSFITNGNNFQAHVEPILSLYNLDPSCQYFMIHPPKLLPAHTFHFRDWNICRFHEIWHFSEGRTILSKNLLICNPWMILYEVEGHNVPIQHTGPSRS